MLTAESVACEVLQSQLQHQSWYWKYDEEYKMHEAQSQNQATLMRIIRVNDHPQEFEWQVFHWFDEIQQWTEDGWYNTYEGGWVSLGYGHINDFVWAKKRAEGVANHWIKAFYREEFEVV